MTPNKTRPTDVDVAAFLQSIDHPTRRADALALVGIFEHATGFAAKMWGPSIIGFGRYHYMYESGREGDCQATGFAPRATSLSIYIMPGYQDYSEILSRLGKHKMGKACLYVNKLADIDVDVLSELITAGVRDLNAIWRVLPE